MLDGALPYLICLGIGLVNVCVGIRVLLDNVAPVLPAGPLRVPLLDADGHANADSEDEEEVPVQADVAA